jgi:hypothetical protein
MRRLLIAVSVAALAAGYGGALDAQTGAQTKTAKRAPPAAPTQTQDIDPAATQALNRMAAYLRTLDKFEVKSNTDLDLVQDDGEKLTFAGTVDYIVDRPNKLYADLRTDRKHRRYFYDGKTLTVEAPRMGYYARTDAPPTIRQLADMAQNDYGIPIPLADLFAWGDPSADQPPITSAQLIGYAEIGTAATDQYAFRSPNADWQIWIERGARPLPRKMVITDRTDPSHPSYTAVLDWNLNPTIAANRFTFTPGKDAKQIQFAAAAPQGTQR